MRFNGKELAAVALQPSYKFDKEGVLLIKEKQDGLFRRGEVFTPRFCRLRGNMLFYFKTSHQCSEPAGVFILEHCTVHLDNSTTDGNHYFTLTFEGDKNPQHFATCLESERDTWIQALHMASYEYMRSQLRTLQEKLSSFRQINGSSNQAKLSRAKSLGDSADEPFLEMSLACDNLLCDGDGTAPNPMLIIFLMTPPETQWQYYMQTEMLERCSNPCFLTTVGLRSNDNIKETTKVKISAHDVREKLTSTMTLIGSAVFTISQMTEAEKNKLRLTLLSADNATVGFVTITVWQVEPEVNSSTSNQPSPHNEQVIARSRSQTLPVKLPSKPKTVQLTQLGQLYDSIISQTYRFHTGLGADLSVHEIMAENKLAFKFPQSLLVLYIKEEKEYLNCLTSFGELAPEWNKKQIEDIERHLQLINSYTQALTFLDSYEGPNFKASALKGEVGLEFVPVNLHLQRMWVQNDSTRKSGFYDVLTVGAFAAHSMKFKHGGLLRLLSGIKQVTRSEWNNSKSSKKVADKYYQTGESTCQIRNLRQDLRDALERLNSLAHHHTEGEMQTVMMDIRNMANQITKLCEPILIEEAFRFLEEIRSPKSTNIHNGHVGNKRNSPLHIYSSPSHDFHSRSSSVEKDTVPSSSSSPEEKSDVGKDWPLKRLQHRRSASDAHLYVDPDSESKDVDRHSLFNLQISEECAGKKCAKNEPYCSPSISRKLAWKLQRHHSAKEDTRSSNSSLGMGENRGSLMHFLRRSGSKQRHERSLINMNCSENIADSNKGENLVSLEKSQKSISLRSLNGSRLRSKSPDEPEPWQSSEMADQKCLIQIRRDIVFSQALTAAVAGIMTRLWCLQPDPSFLARMKEIGILLEFEGLLSCYGDEMGMLEDMVVAISDLHRVVFKLKRSNNDSKAHPTVEGRRTDIVVSLPVPDIVLTFWPLEAQENYSFTITPVFFNVGINEQATFAEKKTSCMHSVPKYTRFGDTSLQDKINIDGAEKLCEFYEKFKQIPFEKEKYQRNSLSSSTKSIDLLLDQLIKLVHHPRSKNSEVLHTAAEVCRLLGGIRFTSCKSAKDRTAMSVTLEQCFVLRDQFDLAEHEFHHALNCMRCEGTRRENTLKNAGIKKYAFNSLQLMALPKLYRPPPGTYGNVQT